MNFIKVRGNGKGNRHIGGNNTDKNQSRLEC